MKVNTMIMYVMVPEGTNGAMDGRSLVGTRKMYELVLVFSNIPMGIDSKVFSKMASAKLAGSNGVMDGMKGDGRKVRNCRCRCDIGATSRWN